MHAVNWLPHGRSWKICNREIFTEIALPRYFGHKNYASFVRIVNAWGFRRVTSGLDRDSYYHEVSNDVFFLAIIIVTESNSLQASKLLLNKGTSCCAIILPVLHSFVLLIASSFFAESQNFINA